MNGEEIVQRVGGGIGTGGPGGKDGDRVVDGFDITVGSDGALGVRRSGAGPAQEVGGLPEIDGVVVGRDGNGLAGAADNGGRVVVRIGVGGGGRHRLDRKSTRLNS